MLTSQSLELLATSLALAQGELGDATKSSTNPAFKSKYADLAEVLQTIRPTLAKHGLSFVQGTGYDPTTKHATVTTRLMHKSGEFIEDQLTVKVGKDDAQGLGSAITYGRRYALAAMIGIAQDDDDGNGASTKAPKPSKAESGPAKSADPEPAKDDAKVASLGERFDAAESVADLQALTKDYAKLTAAEQAELLPKAKAARTRVEQAGKK